MSLSVVTVCPIGIAGVSCLPPDAAYGTGRAHPRGAGSYARFLKMIRENKELSVREALAKVSYLPAKFLEGVAPDMRKRGRIQVGSFADITIFDFGAIADRATHKTGEKRSAVERHYSCHRQWEKWSWKIAPLCEARLLANRSGPRIRMRGV